MLVSGIEIEVVKKRIKNMHLYVFPPNGRVRATVPLFTSDKSVQIFVISKIDWIKKQIKVFENRPKQPDFKFVNGENHYLWGREYSLEVRYVKRTINAAIMDDKMILNVRETSSPAIGQKIINEFYRSELKSKLPALFEKWEKIIGVKIDAFGIKNMRTRWGTCNIKNKKIWINLQLAKKPIYCLEYIVIHELVHLIQKNHGSAFKKQMDIYLPNWRELRSELNNIVFTTKN